MSMFLFGAFVIAILYYRLSLYKKRVASSYVIDENMPQTVPKRSYFSFFVRTVCLVAAWVLLTICLIKVSDKTKQIIGSPKPTQIVAGRENLPKIDEIAFVLDVSASMNATDTSDGSSRLEKAKEIIGTLIEDLGGINCSLIAFGGNCQTVVPDTLDYLYFRILMEAEGVNDTGEAGTNLLAMVDAIKAKYVNSPYKKTVQIVLLTDGEDTGFLAMDAQAASDAENTLIEHLGSTVSDSLEWEVIGLGTDAGAVVPDITYEGKPVTSQMKRQLLERMAVAGHGHFYADVDMPITEVCDDILASVAGSGSLQNGSRDSTVSTFAPKLTFETIFLLVCAIIFILASIILPQYEKKRPI
ncbi:MAG: VWA domain-containing protein [Chlamydiales bacterium]|nr:VWA domain-containing protein [Chlamydiales bacterium]